MFGVPFQKGCRAAGSVNLVVVRYEIYSTAAFKFSPEMSVRLLFSSQGKTPDPLTDARKTLVWKGKNKQQKGVGCYRYRSGFLQLSLSRGVRWLAALFVDSDPPNSATANGFGRGEDQAQRRQVIGSHDRINSKATFFSGETRQPSRQVQASCSKCRRLGGSR